MKKNIFIYDNDRHRTGIWASERLMQSYAGGDCEEIVVEIPDDLDTYKTAFGDTMIKLGEFFCPLDECLRIDKNDHPYLRNTDRNGRPVKLKVIERIGRRSLAYTI